MKRSVWPYVLLTLAPLFWSGNVVLARAVRGDIAPMALIVWRWTIALAILLPLTGAELWRQRRALRAHWRILGVLGFLGTFLYQALSYQALTATTALNALLITATAPLLTALLHWLVYRETITRRLGVAICLSLVGVGIVISRGDVQLLLGLRLNPGDLLMLAATLVWAGYCILLERYRPAGVSSTGLVSVLALVGLVFALPVYLWQSGGGVGFTMVWPNILTLLYMGVFASVLGYLCWNEGVRRGGANLAGLFYNLLPVFGVGLAIVFLGEDFTLYHGIGAALVFGGIVLGTHAHHNSGSA
ncbi:MAG: hypothetical protein PCFJNLEI_00095 [Verrucomicrobiae bacterium]|nr:hypothetical protein [Verrucomicrobiae bacterium]